MSAYQAKQQFDENLRLFGNASTEPEKYNLYASLTNLANVIQSIENDLHTIKEEIRQIKSRI